MKDFLKDLFQYNHFYNRQLIEIFEKEAGRTTERSVSWINHILNAHQVWNARVLKIPSTLKSWDLHPLNELKDLDELNFNTSFDILDRIELEAVIEYRTFKGDPFSNRVKDVLFHVINHSTYHRGQIAAEFRQHGLEPIVSDYIFYKR